MVGAWPALLRLLQGSSDLLDGDALVTMYFDVRAPFETTGDKKSEYPDAIELLELEAHGARAGRYVLAVSRDGGWAAFAANAQWLVVVADLTEALAMFNRGAPQSPSVSPSCC